MDSFALASRIVNDRFSGAMGAWLTGSSVGNRATATSDVDVVVVAPVDSEFRETFLSDGQLVELFVHTESSLGEWQDKERLEYRCTLANMVAGGKPLIQSDRGDALQSSARLLVDAGPPLRSDEEIDALRYHVSAATDDLADASADEVTFVAVEVVTLASELRLANRQAWTGRGKWLHRWLAAASPAVAHRLSEAILAIGTDRQLLLSAAQEVLDGAGGRLQEGYQVGG